MTFVDTPDINSAYAYLTRWRAEGKRCRMIATKSGRWLVAALDK